MNTRILTIIREIQTRAQELNLTPVESRKYARRILRLFHSLDDDTRTYITHVILTELSYKNTLVDLDKINENENIKLKSFTFKLFVGFIMAVSLIFIYTGALEVDSGISHLHYFFSAIGVK